jgi:hypothetical protein
MKIVLEDVTTKRSFVIPARRDLEGGARMSGGGMVRLPPDLPRARYRIFFRAFEDGKPVGDGHGVEAELPPPAP